jgi:arsenite methyltransferase
MDTDEKLSRRFNDDLDYGLDAPRLVRFFLVAGALAAIAFILALVTLGDRTWLGVVVTTLAAIAALYFFGMGCLMLHWSKVTKVREREKALNLIHWRGDELVLDVGCGRGLMLIGAALRLTTGRVIGVDIWKTEDQSSNSLEAARDNALKAGVLGRVDIHTADARTLPFEDRSIDIVLSHWVVHNLENEPDRELALTEIARVLRPGGQLILCDIEHRDAYAAKLQALGFSECRVIFNPLMDAVLGWLSFGSFRPSTISARMPM